MTNAETLDRVRAGLARETAEQARARLVDERWLPPATADTMHAALTKVDDHLAAIDSLFGVLRADTTDGQWTQARDVYLASRLELEAALAAARNAYTEPA